MRATAISVSFWKHARAAGSHVTEPCHRVLLNKSGCVWLFFQIILVFFDRFPHQLCSNRIFSQGMSRGGRFDHLTIQPRNESIRPHQHLRPQIKWILIYISLSSLVDVHTSILLALSSFVCSNLGRGRINSCVVHSDQWPFPVSNNHC